MGQIKDILKRFLPMPARWSQQQTREIMALLGANHEKLLQQINNISVAPPPLVASPEPIENAFLKFEIFEVQNETITGKNVKFYWAVHSKATDPISWYARTGYVPIEHELLELFPNPGTFVDIGANIGAFSFSFAACGWKGYALEASHNNVTVLKTSNAVNRFDVSITETAVFDRVGEINFVQNGPWGQIVFEPSEYSVQCTTMDEWHKYNPVTKVDLIKMDIEGSEMAALRGMKVFLEKMNYPPIFTEVNVLTLMVFDETQKSFMEYANTLGYKPYALQDGKLVPWDADRLPEVVCTDYLLIHTMPDEWSTKLSDTLPTQTKEEVIAQLLQRFNNRNQWENYEVYIAYALKDYPEYYQNSEIKEHLLAIAKEQDTNPYAQRAVQWFLEL